MEQTGKQVDFSFDSGGLAVDDIARLTADMWADLAFDRDALAALKRDGLTLDGVNLGGLAPYRFAVGDDSDVRVTAIGDHAEMLLDLWRVHFLRGLRPRNLAA
ncbi:hypothetical protein [Sphingomonas oryzagri]